jgi:hypothetical protein
MALLLEAVTSPAGDAEHGASSAGKKASSYGDRLTQSAEAAAARLAEDARRSIGILPPKEAGQGPAAAGEQDPWVDQAGSPTSPGSVYGRPCNDADLPPGHDWAGHDHQPAGDDSDGSSRVGSYSDSDSDDDDDYGEA